MIKGLILTNPITFITLASIQYPPIHDSKMNRSNALEFLGWYFYFDLGKGVLHPSKFTSQSTQIPGPTGRNTKQITENHHQPSIFPHVPHKSIHIFNFYHLFPPLKPTPRNPELHRSRHPRSPRRASRSSAAPPPAARPPGASSHRPAVATRAPGTSHARWPSFGGLGMEGFSL